MEGGIFMHQDSNEAASNVITMEEYLKRRQAIKQNEMGPRSEREQVAASALKMAEILFV